MPILEKNMECQMNYYNNIYNYPSDNSEDNYPEDSLYITDEDVYIGFISRKKVIHFYPDSGLETGIGFYYGLNTISVERTINSDDIITKLIVENNSNELLSKYIEMLSNTICECVIATNQTYVDSLKKQGKFDVEA